MVVLFRLILKILTYLFLAGSLSQIKMFKILLRKKLHILIFLESTNELLINLAILTVIILTELRFLPWRKFDLFIKLNIDVEVFLFQRHVLLVQLLIVFNWNFTRRWIYDFPTFIFFLLLFLVQFVDNWFQILGWNAYLEVRELLFICAATFINSLYFIIHFI